VVAVRPVVSWSAAGGMVDLVEDPDAAGVAVDEQATRMVASTPPARVTAIRRLRPGDPPTVDVDVITIPPLWRDREHDDVLPEVTAR
jgi:hypothetical protein